MWPWAAAYSFQVVIAMVVFNLFQGPGMSDEPKGGGIVGALISGAIFMVPTIALYRARALFNDDTSKSADEENTAAS